MEDLEEEPASAEENWGEIKVEDIDDFDDSIAGDLLGLDYTPDGSEEEDEEMPTASEKLSSP